MGRFCITCHSTCATCTAEMDSNTCLTCSDPTHVLRMDKTCQSDCPPRQYPDINKVCKDCHSTCESCSGPLATECIICRSTHPFYNTVSNLCVTNCLSEGEYVDGTQCKACHGTCKTCNGSTSTNCLTCPTNKVLRVDKSCQDQCLSTSFINGLGVCQACAPQCKTCINSPS